MTCQVSTASPLLPFSPSALHEKQTRSLCQIQKGLALPILSSIFLFVRFEQSMFLYIPSQEKPKPNL